MKIAKKTVGALFLGALVGAPAFAKQNTEEKKEDNLPVYVVTTYAMATNTGCWATFYDDEDFKGERVTLAGDKAISELDFDLKPYKIGGEPDSVTVGPKATLELYGDENFKDLDHKFDSDTKVANLKQEPFWDKIESVRLRCK